MKIKSQIAKHFREVHFGRNWTAVNFKDALADVTWQQATTKVGDLNTIAILVFHSNYYVSEVLKVFNGKRLEAKDEYSFGHPPINSKKDWDAIVNKLFTDAEDFEKHIEILPDEKLLEVFDDEKHGNYYRNLHGIIEHCHYHLGQIVMIKKLLKHPEFRTSYN